MLKLLFNIFIIYAIWQLVRMFFTVKKVQTEFHKNMSDLNDKVNNAANQQQTGKSSGNKKNNPLDTEGEYVDYEEIK